MADRFHFNPDTGRTGKCAAQIQCHFGQSDSQHGATREEARANYEEHMEPELFSNTVHRAEDAPRFTPEQLDGEALSFEDRTGYSPGELIELRGVEEWELEEADRLSDGWYTLKPPSGVETRISTALARRELSSHSSGENQRSRFW